MDVITHNTVVLNWQPKACAAQGQYFITKVHLREKDERHNDEIGSHFKWFAVSELSPSHIPLLLSRHVSPFISLSLLLSLSLLALLSVFISETINDGLCVRRNKVTLKQIRRPSGQTGAISLPVSILLALWTAGQKRAWRSAPRSCDTLRDWFDGGGWGGAAANELNARGNECFYCREKQERNGAWL